MNKSQLTFIMATTIIATGCTKQTFIIPASSNQAPPAAVFSTTPTDLSKATTEFNTATNDINGQTAPTYDTREASSDRMKSTPTNHVANPVQQIATNDVGNSQVPNPNDTPASNCGPKPWYKKWLGKNKTAANATAAAGPSNDTSQPSDAVNKTDKLEFTTKALEFGKALVEGGAALLGLF